jgi:ABC-2 type transport system permease protein
METIIPKTSTVLLSLLRADYRTQWSNRRSVVLSVLVPAVILISWKDIVDKIGGAFALSTCITVGLMSIGLMGYSNSIARDRDKGVFQRLRVAPVPSWTIMVSRLLVQLTMILIVTLAVFIVGYYFDHITISPGGYALAFLAALVGGAVYLSLGQVIVGLIKNPETIQSTTRLVYFAFIMIGMLGEFGILGKELQQDVHWSPYGVVKSLLSASLQPGQWKSETLTTLAITISYSLAFATLGIRWFKWNSR